MTTSTFAHVSADSTLTIGTEEVADPGPSEVVDILSVGVCGTDVHGYQAPQFLPAAVFGHEWAGTVRAIGSEVTSVAAGDLVVASVGPACGTCAACLAGFSDTCELVYAEANGVDAAAPAHGAFATTVLVSERRVQKALKGLTHEQAALVEPTTVTFHAVKRTRQPLGALVVVQGAGPIGLLTAQHARHAGAREVIIVETNPTRRETAATLGFTSVFEPGNDFVAYVKSVSAGLGADVLYECTGVTGLFQASAELVRRGGTLSLLGYPTKDSEVSHGDWQSRQLTVIGSLAYTHDDFTGAMAAIVSGAVEVTTLHTKAVGLSGLKDVLDDLGSGASVETKVLIDPRL